MEKCGIFSLAFKLFEFVIQGIREQFIKNVHYFTVLHTHTYHSCRGNSHHTQMFHEGTREAICPPSCMDLDEDRQSRLTWLLEQLKRGRFIPAVLAVHILDAGLVTLRLTLRSPPTFVPSSPAHA